MHIHEAVSDGLDTNHWCPSLHLPRRMPKVFKVAERARMWVEGVHNPFLGYLSGRTRFGHFIHSYIAVT